MKKISELAEKIKITLQPKLANIDAKFQTFMPNPKLRKILYITVVSFISLFVFLLLLSLILSPLKNKGDGGFILNKPKTISSTPVSQKELNDTQKKLQELQNTINDLRFPESILNVPTIERGLSI